MKKCGKRMWFLLIMLVTPRIFAMEEEEEDAITTSSHSSKINEIEAYIERIDRHLLEKFQQFLTETNSDMAHALRKLNTYINIPSKLSDVNETNQNEFINIILKAFSTQEKHIIYQEVQSYLVTDIQPKILEAQLHFNSQNFITNPQPLIELINKHLLKKFKQFFTNNNSNINLSLRELLAYIAIPSRLNNVNEMNQNELIDIILTIISPYENDKIYAYVKSYLVNKMQPEILQALEQFNTSTFYFK